MEGFFFFLNLPPPHTLNRVLWVNTKNPLNVAMFFNVFIFLLFALNRLLFVLHSRGSASRYPTLLHLCITHNAPKCQHMEADRSPGRHVVCPMTRDSHRPPLGCRSLHITLTDDVYRCVFVTFPTITNSRRGDSSWMELSLFRVRYVSYRTVCVAMVISDKADWRCSSSLGATGSVCAALQHRGSAQHFHQYVASVPTLPLNKRPFSFSFSTLKLDFIFLFFFVCLTGNLLVKFF